MQRMGKLCVGAPQPLREKLNLQSVEYYKYLRQSNCYSITGVDDAEEFCIVMDALDVVHISKGDQENVFAILAAVLWLRNISFTVINNENHIQKLTLSQASDARDTLAKSIYACLFDWLIEQINKSLAVGKRRTAIQSAIVQARTGGIHEYIQDLFGSDDLVQAPGIFKISDEDRLHSFSESYKLGTNLVEGAHSPNLASLDVKLVPEHLLYLSIERGRKFLSSSKSANRYNFYKDSNAHEIERMLKVLAPLRQQIMSNLNEWEEQNDLQKIWLSLTCS
ncbi:hypothetical protein RYX36_002311 [Vicia faba]